MRQFSSAYDTAIHYPIGKNLLLEVGYHSYFAKSHVHETTLKRVALRLGTTLTTKKHPSVLLLCKDFNNFVESFNTIIMKAVHRKAPDIECLSFHV